MENLNLFSERRLMHKTYNVVGYSLGSTFLEFTEYEISKDKLPEQGLFDSPYIKPKYVMKENSEKNEDNKQRSVRRAKQNFRRLVLSNLYKQQFLFLTLTFAENEKDLDYAYLKLKIFLKQIRKFQDIKYLGVFEYQKRGAIHFHIFIFNLDWLPKKILDKWRKPNGFLKIKVIDPKDHVKTASYLTKYFMKSYEKDLFGRKRYFSSKNLARPIKYLLSLQEFKELDLENYKMYNIYNSVKTEEKIIYKKYERI
jgi:hypothetical protein